MIIQGLQKLTLLDYPEQVACTIFTAGCNFRCPFCHNASLVVETDKYAKISEAAVMAFLQKRQGTLDGVCISGGEPLLQADLEDFVARVKALGYLIKLDTNGSYPDKLKRLLDSGNIDYVAMDLKNSPEKYGLTIGIADYDLTNIDRSVRLLMKGRVPYEFRTTVVRELHTKADLAAMARGISGARAYYLQQFRTSDDMITTGLHAYDEKIMQQALEIVRREVPNAQLRGIG